MITITKEQKQGLKSKKQTQQGVKINLSWLQLDFSRQKRRKRTHTLKKNNSKWTMDLKGKTIELSVTIIEKNVWIFTEENTQMQ